MRVVIQRASRASVTVEGVVVGAIDQGLVLLIGVEVGDTTEQVDYCVRKCLNAKLFAEQPIEGHSPRTKGEWRRSVIDVEGGVLALSQFTLFGNIKKGTKPDFHRAMPPADALVLFNYFVASLKKAYSPTRIQQGVFGAYSAVELVNDGPTTLTLES
jgi:D-aminoacyl-tRNA deacylase